MASKTVPLSATAYTKLDTGTETAILAQNKNAFDVDVIFATSLPAAGADGDFTLKPGDAILRNGMTGDMYAKPAGGTINGSMTVGE